MDPTVPTLTPEQFLQEAVKLFAKHREHFGMTNAAFPDDTPEEKQIEYENEFAELICKARGHELIPDHCMRPEHDYCVICELQREAIEGNDPTPCGGNR